MTTPVTDGAMPSGNFDPTLFIEIARHHGHNALIGMTCSAHGEDWAEIALPWREDLVGVRDSGLLASGAIVSSVDMASAISVWIKAGEFRSLVTLDLRLDYLRPARKHETVFARCRCIRLTRSVAFVTGVAHVGDSNDPIALATATFVATT